MADAVIANWDGHDYQARFFWFHASGLRNPETPHVVEVSYEADGPKGFDDVIVRYNPGMAGRRSFRVDTAHHQVKFHVNQAGRFGFKDLTTPEFTGASAVSILQRLKDAVAKAPPRSTFTLITTDRVRDDDPLSKLLRTADKSLDIDRLAVGKTPRSEMGKVRALWRKHLDLESDDELYRLLDTFHIMDGYHSLQDMRENVDLRFQVVGLIPGGNNLEFKFDGAARALKATSQNILTRDAFEALCIEQGWVRTGEPDDRKNISIRSFTDGPTDYLDAQPDNTLSLVEMFNVRHLRKGFDWNTHVASAVVEFLLRVRQTDTDIRLYLDSHSSIAFLAGATLGFKTSTHVELNQKGRGPTTVWRSDDGKVGPLARTEATEIGAGDDIAIVVSLSRNALADVDEFIRTNVPSIGKILHVVAADGPSQKALRGGEHAADLADQVAAALKDLRPPITARRHFFISAPNSFSFFMGQHRDSMGPVTLYEFDFKTAVDGSYAPTIRIG